MGKKQSNDDAIRFADVFAALGTESRLRIMQLLLKSYPNGMVVGEIQSELDFSGANLSHHLEKLKNEGLVEVSREGTFLRYKANTDTLQEVLSFLYAACCTSGQAVNPAKIVQLCK